MKIQLSTVTETIKVNWENGTTNDSKRSAIGAVDAVIHEHGLHLASHSSPVQNCSLSTVHHIQFVSYSSHFFL